MKKNISLPDATYQRALVEAEKSGLSFSSFLALALNRYMDEQDAIRLLPQLMEQYGKAKESTEA